MCVHVYFTVNIYQSMHISIYLSIYDQVYFCPYLSICLSINLALFVYLCEAQGLISIFMINVLTNHVFRSFGNAVDIHSIRKVNEWLLYDDVGYVPFEFSLVAYSTAGQKTKNS